MDAVHAFALGAALSGALFGLVDKGKPWDKTWMAVKCFAAFGFVALLVGYLVAGLFSPLE
jgi:hypothetical protein